MGRGGRETNELAGRSDIGPATDTAMSASLWLRRAQDPPGLNDGYRVLVDRLWPRGITKEAMALDEWCRDVAPSDTLRRWFGHDRQRWEGFRQRYLEELAECAEPLDRLVRRLERGRVTLVFAARDRRHNNAVVLRGVLEQRLDGLGRNPSR